MRRHALTAASLLVLVTACGAKTGLRIPEYRVDAGPIDAGVDAAICMPRRVALTPETAELMLVIDRSTSMSFTIDGTPGQPQDQWRWTIMQGALDMALRMINPRILVGAKFFPDPQTPPRSTLQACTATGPVDVRPAVGTAPAILSIFSTTRPSGGTPTAEALRVAAGALSPSGPRRFLLLATDGAPNCNGGLPQLTCRCTSPSMVCLGPDPGPFSCLDDARTIGVLTDLYANRRIPTYVVGIDGQGFSDVLDAMAIAGGRPLAGARAFYSVTSAGDLQRALMDITQSISACGLSTPTLPPPGARFSIEIDGVPTREDAANGWTWRDRATGEIELHGASCASVTRAGRIEAIIDACPR